MSMVPCIITSLVKPRILCGHVFLICVQDVTYLGDLVSSPQCFEQVMHAFGLIFVISFFYQMGMI